jgi:hypothetical protein
MSEILDTHFPEPEGEWVGARFYVESIQKFEDFNCLIETYGFTEKTAEKIVSQDVGEWPEDVRYKLRGYKS